MDITYKVNFCSLYRWQSLVKRTFVAHRALLRLSTEPSHDALETCEWYFEALNTSLIDSVRNLVVV